MKQSLMLGIGGLVVVAVLGYFLLNTNNQSTTSTNSVQPSAMMEKEEDKTMEAKNIVEVAQSAGNFSTLIAAVTQAGLVETLSGPGPFTVFAPTDEAFAKVPKTTLDSLLADKEQLTKVLTYHVVSGKVMAADVVSLTSATTVEGSDVQIKVDGGKVMVDNANVVQTDIEASNGVIHVIDSVILPQ